jgi:DNA-binding NarL/FixJ family response regulator
MDEVAVIRLTTGSPVTSTKAERLEAVRLLIGRGYSTAVVAERLHTTPRSIWRYRAELHRREVAA